MNETPSDLPMTWFEKIGLFYVMTVPVLAGLSMFIFEINGFNYTGYLWMAQYVVGVGLLVWTALFSGGFDRAVVQWKPWMAWCGLLIVSLLWNANIDRRVLQDVAQLTMPVIVGMVAAASVHTRAGLGRLLHVFWVPLVCVGIFTRYYVAEVNSSEYQWVATPDGYSVRSTALAVALIGCMFFADFPRRKLMPLGVWGACVLITTLTSSRMAALVLLAVPVFHLLYPTRRWNLAVACGMLVVALGLFFTPMFQQHFFESGQGDLSDLSGDEFMDNGRFYAWNRVWDEALEHPLLGTGVGSINETVSEFWEGISVVHNDYLRFFYELGMVGVSAFLALIVWQMLTLWRMVEASDGVVRASFAAVWLGFIALLMSCFTDNTITYHIYFTNPLFVVLGAAYGVYFAEHARSLATTRTSEAPAIIFGYQGTGAYSPSGYGADPR
jgi:O-antigen ligase